MAGVVMTSPAPRTSWVFIAAQSYAVILLMLAWLSAVVVDGHQPTHSRRPSSPGDHRGIHDSKVVQDTEHISEHLQELKEAVNVSAMSKEELEFHYFKMHDYDNNTKLDGLEIFKAITHLLDEEETEAGSRGKSAEDIARLKREKELQNAEIVDMVLDMDDIDDDGYLTYPEYIVARRRVEADEEIHSSTSSSSDSHPSDHIL